MSEFLYQSKKLQRSLTLLLNSIGKRLLRSHAWNAVRLTFFTFVFANLLYTNSAFGAIALRGTATTGTSTNTNLTINIPTGVVSGDVLIVDIAQYVNSNVILSNPTLSGWTLIAGADLQSNKGRWGTLLYKIVGISEPANYTFILNAQTTSSSGAIVAFSGVDGTNTFDVVTGTISVQGSQTAVVSTSKTTVTSNTAIIMFGMAAGSLPTWSGWTTTSLGNLTELYDNQSTGASVGAAWATMVIAGATGAGGANLNASERNGGILIALKAALPPSITTLSPSTGCQAANGIVITGTNFTGATGVKFNGVTASYTVNSATQITASVPLTATTGAISVTTSAGTATSISSFTVNPLPAVPLNPTSNSPQCIGFGVTLTRTGTPPVGETWYWQTIAGGTSTVNSGTTYNVASSGTYYISSQNNSSLCWSSGSGSATVAVNTAPTIIGSSGSLCGPGTVDLGANASAGVINWYDAGGYWIKTGPTYTTPSLSSSAIYYVDATSGGCTSTPRTAVQAVIISPATISVGGAGTCCNGSTISLTSTGANLTNQYWTGPDAIGPTHFYSTAQNPVITGATVVNAGTYTVTGSALSGINLVANGDFELGNIGFSTSYTYRDSTYAGNSPNGALWKDGDYCVVANPNSTHANFSACPDHTPSGHLQMVINGAATSKNIWLQTVNVVPNTAYQFTYWVQSVNPQSPSQSQLYVNNTALGIPYTADATTCNWKQFVYNWTSGPGVTSALLELQNQNTATGGNDFALDDIIFQQACETTGIGIVKVNAVPAAGAIGNAQTICRGYTPGAITSTFAGTGTGLISYEWQTNASGSYVTIPGASAAIYTPPALAANTSYQRRTVDVSGGATCYSVYTNQILITVNGPTINAGGADAACQLASPVAITLTGASFGGAATAAWSILLGGGTLSSTAQTATPQNVTYTPGADYNGTVLLQLKTNVVAALGNCDAIAERTIIVNPTTAITGQSTGTQTQCIGGTFTSINVTATGGGLTYQWYKNGSASTSGGTSLVAANGAQTNSYTPQTTSSGTLYYYCIVTGTCGSATSAISGAFIVNPSLPVSVSIVASANPVCLGTSVTFTATPINGGTPSYQWKVNGSNVGTGTSTYSYIPSTGDLITCILTSNVTPCATLNPATSNTISMTFSAAPVAGTLTPTPGVGFVCDGTSVSATATAGSNGTSPIDVLQYRYDGNVAWTPYTSGSGISTGGHTSIDIQTYRTASGAGCNLSAPVTVSWTINPVPVSGILTSLSSLGAVCSGASISATATTGSGGAGSITDVLQYRFDGGGSWINYTSGVFLSTPGHTSVDIQTYRIATGSGCTSSTPVVLSWTINAQPVSGTVTPSPAVGTYCAGTLVSALGTAGSGGAGTTTDIMQYRFDGGTWTDYTPGSSLNTNGHTTVDIQTFRTATGSGCTTSVPVVASWILKPLPTTSEITTN